MKCEECQKQGLTSRIYVGGTTATLMAAEYYYDEEGRYHAHDPNNLTTTFACSNGHHWSETSRDECWCEKEQP